MSGRLKIKAAELCRHQLLPGAGGEASAVPWQPLATVSPPGTAAASKLVLTGLEVSVEELFCCLLCCYHLGESHGLWIPPPWQS